ncbi:hypothetical protein GOP47_0025959 [Adiantum capillus-veneris]|uniref:Uncharacterized protein n=1 Tax=Adiantum capillus-veneris TaxID=13818 RepID=A0A9D4U2B0_ADICA|nr:hypothetical protein GOP47_0025959 [Adiantum capillus-veneris]
MGEFQKENQNLKDRVAQLEAENELLRSDAEELTKKVKESKVVLTTKSDVPEPVLNVDLGEVRMEEQTLVAEKKFIDQQELLSSPMKASPPRGRFSMLTSYNLNSARGGHFLKCV